MNRREFLKQALLTLPAATLLPGCLSSSRNSRAQERQYPWMSVHRIHKRNEIRLLQFTDIHFFNGIIKTPKVEEQKRLKTQDDIKRLIDHAEPDLIVVTGDFWHENPHRRGEEFMNYAVGQAESWGAPWCFTWGNHDQLSNFSAGHKRIASARRSLYRGQDSEGNYLLSLTDHHDEPLVQLVCLNSGKQGLGGREHRWLTERLALFDGQPAEKRPMRLAAMHIPLKQYKEVWDNGAARGIIGERVASEDEDGGALQLLKRAGVQAAICGHDHTNDFSGALDGVEMVYGRATGQGGYGAEKIAKGAKLYRLDPVARQLKWSSLLPDGREWFPDDGMRKDLRD